MPVPENESSEIPSKWFGADLLKGRPREVIVSDVNKQEFEDFKTKEPVAKYVLTLTTTAGDAIRQRLILNQTRLNQMNTLYGKRPAKWPGKHLILSASKTTFGGMTVDLDRPPEPEDNEQPGLDDADGDEELF